MFAITKKCLLHYYVNGSNYTKCMSLGNQKCMIQPTLNNLHPNEWSWEFHYNSFTIKLDRCVESCHNLMTYLIKHDCKNK